jgi:hypothetical protein
MPIRFLSVTNKIHYFCSSNRIRQRHLHSAFSVQSDRGSFSTGGVTLAASVKYCSMAYYTAKRNIEAQ